MSDNILIRVRSYMGASVDSSKYYNKTEVDDKIQEQSERLADDIAELQEDKTHYEDINNGDNIHVELNTNYVYTILNAPKSLSISIPTSATKGYLTEINYITGEVGCPITFNNLSVFNLQIVYWGRIYTGDYVIPPRTHGSLLLSHNGREIQCFINEIRE